MTARPPDVSPEWATLVLEQLARAEALGVPTVLRARAMLPATVFEECFLAGCYLKCRLFDLGVPPGAAAEVCRQHGALVVAGLEPWDAALRQLRAAAAAQRQFDAETQRQFETVN